MAKKKTRDAVDEEENLISFNPPAYLPTGLDLIDWCIGGYGLPFGRVIRVSGRPNVGKSSFAEQVMGSYLKRELGDIYLFEGEGKPHIEGYMKAAFGIGDLKRLKGLRPPTLGKLWEKLEQMSWEKDEGLWIIDSLSSFGEPDTKDGIPKPMAEAQRLGLEAVKNTDAMKRGFYRRIAEKKILVITVNHLRDTIGFNGQHEPGGTANHYQSSVDIRVKLDAILEDKAKELVLGQVVIFEIARNMVGPPHRKASIPLYYGMGWANEESIVDLAIRKGKIYGGGGWYCLENTEGVQKYRKYEIVQLMIDNPDLKSEIKRRVLE